MSLDEHLRDGLEGFHGIEDAPLDRILDEVVRRGRRRRLARRIAASVVALAAAVAIVGIAPKALDALRSLRNATPTTPQDVLREMAGTYEVVIEPAGGAISAYEMQGTWTVKLLRTGALEISPPAAFVRAWSTPTGASFTVSPGTLRTNAFTNLFGTQIATYSWILADDHLTFHPLLEDCELRRALFTSATWTRET